MPLLVLMFCIAFAAGVPAANADELPLAEVLRIGLGRNIDIRVQQRQVDVALAQEQQASGIFDWVLSSNLNYNKVVSPLPPSSAVEQNTLLTTGYQVGLDKQLRNGVIVRTDVTASSIKSDVAPVVPRQNAAQLDLQFVIPLLKGAGTEATRAAEDAAKLNTAQNQWQVRTQAAESVYAMMLQYWDYRAQEALMDVAAQTLMRSRDLLASNEKLVAASEKPRADLVLLKADLVDKEAAYEAAQLRATESRKALGRLMGLSLADTERLPRPSDPFPKVLADIETLTARTQQLRALALDARPELKTLDLQMDAIHTLVRAANVNLRPQLDLKVGMSVGTASEGGSSYGFISESARKQSTPSVFAVLNYQIPVGNNVATGRYRELSSSYVQLEMRHRDLEDGVIAAVDSAVQSLVRSGRQLRIAEEGLRFYEKAVSQEIVKQRNGIATLIDVINVESRFVNARISYYQLQLAYANALARLRFETGSIVESGNRPANETNGADLASIDVNGLAGLGPLARLLQSPMKTQGAGS